MIAEVLRAVERFVLPNACVVCERAVDAFDPDSLVCGPCRARLRRVPAGCDRCGQPVPPIGPCRFCSDWPEGFVRATSAVWLGEEAREIVHHLKYEGFTRLSEMVAATIARHNPRPPPFACLVPVPLGKLRRIERGYNQAAEIATALGDLWRMKIDETVIRRRRETASQTRFSPEERVRNMRGVFTAILPHTNRRIRGNMSSGEDCAAGEGSAVTLTSNVAILVDDVFTTGATLASAATALLDAGWTEVRAVTFARAMPFAVRVEAQHFKPFEPAVSGSRST